MEDKSINVLLDKIKNEVIFKDNIDTKYILTCIEEIRKRLNEIEASIDKINEELDKCDV